MKKNCATIIPRMVIAQFFCVYSRNEPLHFTFEEKSDEYGDRKFLPRGYICAGTENRLARGLGITEPVNSPTFTIVQVYDGGRLPFYHFDVYRIGDIEEMDEIGYEDYFYGEGVCLIEWADLIRELLPEHTGRIVIEKDLEKGFDYRRITLEGIDELEA